LRTIEKQINKLFLKKILFTSSYNSGKNICPSLNHVNLAFGLALNGHFNETDADVG
jgi:hypothetical protein